jgi:hypothetical protein
MTFFHTSHHYNFWSWVILEIVFYTIKKIIWRKEFPPPPLNPGASNLQIEHIAIIHTQVADVVKVLQYY